MSSISALSTRVGVGAVSLFSVVTLAACGSDASPSAPSLPRDTGSSSSVTSSSSSSVTSSSSSEVSSAPSTSESSGGSSSGDKAAFCKTYDLKKITAASSNPSAARDNLKQVVKVAPPEIKDDAELIYNVLNDALNGKQPSTSDTSKIRDASANVAKYYVQNCR